MSLYDWFLAGWLLLGGILLVATVGKPRKPIEPAAAAIAVVIDLALVVGLLLSRGVL